MALGQSSDLQKQVKVDNEHSKTEDVENVEVMDGLKRQGTIDDDENTR